MLDSDGELLESMGFKIGQKELTKFYREFVSEIPGLIGEGMGLKMPKGTREEFSAAVPNQLAAFAHPRLWSRSMGLVFDVKSCEVDKERVSVTGSPTPGFVRGMVIGLMEETGLSGDAADEMRRATEQMLLGTLHRQVWDRTRGSPTELEIAIQLPLGVFTEGSMEGSMTMGFTLRERSPAGEENPVELMKPPESMTWRDFTPMLPLLRSLFIARIPSPSESDLEF